MAGGIKHAFVSAKADGADATLIRPSDWNAEHPLSAAPATPVANTLYTDSVVKGWVKFNGTGTPAIVDDLNASSLTDNAVGDWTINWATAFANADYVVVGLAVQTAEERVTISRAATGQAIGSTRIRAWKFDGTFQDPEVVMVIAIGDQ